MQKKHADSLCGEIVNPKRKTEKSLYNWLPFTECLLCSRYLTLSGLFNLNSIPLRQILWSYFKWRDWVPYCLRKLSKDTQQVRGATGIQADTFLILKHIHLHDPKLSCHSPSCLDGQLPDGIPAFQWGFWPSWQRWASYCSCRRTAWWWGRGDWDTDAPLCSYPKKNSKFKNSELTKLYTRPEVPSAAL